IRRRYTTVEGRTDRAEERQKFLTEQDKKKAEFSRALSSNKKGTSTSTGTSTKSKNLKGSQKAEKGDPEKARKSLQDILKKARGTALEAAVRADLSMVAAMAGS
ncbi:MAG: hypothetical protein ACPGQD_05120, partial [Planctomycetota bacterium]